MGSDRNRLGTSRRLARVRARRRRTAFTLAVVVPVAGVLVALWATWPAASADVRPGPLELPARYEPVVVPVVTPEARRLAAVIERLRAFQMPLPVPALGEWLSFHPEKGQTFAEYLRDDPVTARGTRRIIYIQPLGEFDEKQKEIVRLTADFMSRYFGLSVTIRRPLPLDGAPAWARRFRSTLNTTQILTGWVLEGVLMPRLPADAAAYIAFTTADLWPGEGWNFVFGQASLNERVGVWSLFRQGDPSGGPGPFKECLLRTLKIATHETGHMFSMEHCTAYLCNMCGCNSREEADRNPLALCCECVAKVCLATGADPLVRYRRLAEFCDGVGLDIQARMYEILAAALEIEDARPDAPAGAPDAGAQTPPATTAAGLRFQRIARP